LRLARRSIVTTVVVCLVIVIGFIYAQLNIVNKSVHFALSKIGESIYQAHARTGKWPTQVSDLDGTEYLSLPYRRDILEHELYVIVWHKDLDPNPAANRDRILAYENGTILSRLGWIWVCRGDLTIERMNSAEVRAQKGS
jgi:hypothetical protein